jgi:hypothetical protein
MVWDSCGMTHISGVSTSEQNESCSGLGLGFDGLLPKAGPVLGLSMGLDKPAAKCDSCERGESGESNISISYAEMGIEYRTSLLLLNKTAFIDSNSSGSQS